MKDPNLSELVRTCIRCWLYLVPQAFLGIHLFDMFMRRKNSIKPLMIWQLLRVFLIGGISDIILRGYYGNESWWGILMMFCSVVIMIANTVLIYYTFEGQPSQGRAGRDAGRYRNVHDSLSGNLYCGSFVRASALYPEMPGRTMGFTDPGSGISVLQAGEKNNPPCSEKI